MDFKTFYSILFNRIGDTLSSGEFVRDLIAMITSLPEDEWEIKKDPSNRVSIKTYENFAKRGINKKTCKAIVYRLTPENFIESLNTRPRSTRSLLADDLQAFDSTATVDNVANLLADIFIQIIKNGSGLISSDKLQDQKQLQKSFELKNKYGKYLLIECGNSCVMPGCGKSLFAHANGSIQNIYEVSRVDKTKQDTIDNLVCFCPNCFGLYQLDSNTKIKKILKGIKKTQSTHLSSMLEIDALELEKGLADVILQMKKMKPQDFASSTLDPSQINQKINPKDDSVMYSLVHSLVATHFTRVDEILRNLDKKKAINYELLQIQMRGLFVKLNAGKKGKYEIFNEISEKIHKTTLQDRLYCQTIVCYFIQKCEVFNATS